MADQSDMNKTLVRKVKWSQPLLQRPEKGLSESPNQALNKATDTQTI